MEYLLVAAGLVALTLAGDALVRGSVSLAQRLGVSILFISLTVVAFGTSAPELVVAIDSVLTGAPTLALGNVVGSNIANILLIVGLPAMLAGVNCAGDDLSHNTVAMILATVFFILLCLTGPLGPWQGAVLLMLLAGYIYGNIRRARRDPKAAATALADLSELPAKPLGWTATLLLVAGGLIGLVLGADWLVEGAVTIARTWGVSEAVIGLTLVAVGTSLPEMATCVAASLKKHSDVVVGNVLGSNVFNLLAITGTAAMVGTIPVPAEFLRFDLWIMLLTALFLLPFTLKKLTIGVKTGAVFLALYLGYMVVLGMDSLQGPQAQAAIPATAQP
ncbi:MAG: calcium/sodium antiporter [Sphingomonadales bacterium]